MVRVLVVYFSSLNVTTLIFYGLLLAAAQDVLPCGTFKARKPSPAKLHSKIGVFCTTSDHFLWDFTHETLVRHELEVILNYS